MADIVQTFMVTNCFLLLQNQIQAQQAHYVKQQQQGIGYDFKSNPMHDSINALQGNFAELALNKEAVSVSNLLQC